MPALQHTTLEASVGMDVIISDATVRRSNSIASIDCAVDYDAQHHAVVVSYHDSPPYECGWSGHGTFDVRLDSGEVVALHGADFKRVHTAALAAGRWE